jgi:hypothetical protein
MLTFFTTAKPFVANSAIIQRILISTSGIRNRLGLRRQALDRLFGRQGEES